MIKQDGKIDNTTKRMISDKMNKLVGRFCMDDSLKDISFRADIVDLQKTFDALSKAYDEWANKHDKYVVRLYDGFDNQWIDVSKPLSKEEADAVWKENTQNGTRNTSYGDIDYYKVFPADTKMLYSEGFGEI